MKQQWLIWLVASARSRSRLERALVAGIWLCSAPLLAQPDPAALSDGPNVACGGGSGNAAAGGWRLSKATASASILDATQTQQTYQSEVVFTGQRHPELCGWPHQRTLVELLGSYDSKQSKDKPHSALTRVAELSAQHLLFGRDNARYVFLSTDAYHNSALGIYAQESFGAGIGRLFGRAEFTAGVRGINQRFDDLKSTELIGIQLSCRATTTIGRLVLSEMLQVTPVNKSDSWQGRGILTLTAPIGKGFSLAATAFDDYVANAPERFDKNYFKTTIGIQYSPP